MRYLILATIFLCGCENSCKLYRLQSGKTVCCQFMDLSRCGMNLQVCGGGGSESYLCQVNVEGLTP